ncbi:MAG: hypothetical protein A3F84_28125 [Candidatus Handelsmanbacteria bacterium RIFCSPLOWO2_12_FULL_64_10]|uniref:NAD-dependent epimerase/dehydratase domain-containing protein n=1 Tax=Handelsmanbacteria sp. (strain RIFCSPLOWO2_12_FULL_64_10) TaxID=1817868 RepID=A0A1F6CI62_HANXR|nr:MAG: hypothetical protein A3F84_28125 [Candidatus Handelsmanbacteria bacterium RIFCSPLOWO2_12_FULL_64_10]
MILVSGGAGFIGSHLAEALLARGERVQILDDFSSGRRENVPAAAEVVTESDADTVFHLAATTSVAYSVDHPREVYENNVALTVKRLAAGGLKRFIFAGSTAVYGDAPAPVAEDAPCAPESPYAASKLAAEHYVRAFARSRGVATIALRLFNVYGPRQDPRSPYSGVVARFADRLGRDGTLDVFGDGLQTRDFIHVSDVTAAFLRAADVCDGGVYNIGTGVGTSVLELAAAMGRAAGRTAKIAHRPARPGEIRHSRADVRRAREALGFEATVSLEEGLRGLMVRQQ